MTAAASSSSVKPEKLPLDQLRGWLFYHAEDVRMARERGEKVYRVILEGPLEMEAFERLYEVIDFNWANEAVIREAYAAHRRKKRK